jgi:hypothetical protein
MSLMPLAVAVQEVHQRTGEQDQVRQKRQHVRAMVLPQQY